MVTRPKDITALVEAGQVAEAVEAAAAASDACTQALAEAGWTFYGTPLRPTCSCWFYERAPGMHDRFLDLPDTDQRLGWAVLLDVVQLDHSRLLAHAEEPLFMVPEEIRTFCSIHNVDFYGLALDLPRIAEQARWGRLSGRKMAMVHGVPGRDPDYVDLVVDAERLAL